MAGAGSDAGMEFDALVIGAGIAGLQAALDLADQGFQVAVVEKEPSIGGAMIGLSKVFPTLDCSSCITTPKMAAAAHHPNVTIYTYTELLSVEGGPATFTARVRQKARYVNEADCIGCRKCEYACPVEVPDEFEQGMTARRAAYIPFTNAIPQTALIDPETASSAVAASACAPPPVSCWIRSRREMELHAKTIVATTGWSLTPLDAKAEYGKGGITNVIGAHEHGTDAGSPRSLRTGAPPVGRQDARIHRLRAVRRLAGPHAGSAVLLARLLHVCDQAGHAA